MASQSVMSPEDLLDIGTLESLAVLGERRGRDLVGQLYGLFCDQGPQSFAKLRVALEGGDANAFREIAHSLKGSYRSLGTTRLAAISEELETSGREGKLSGQEARVDELEQTFEATRLALDAFLAARRSRSAQGGD